MRLQEVLKEREAEITALEQSLKEKDSSTTPPVQPSLESPTTPVKGDVSPDLHLSPKTRSQFQELRNSLDQPDGLPASDADESLERLNELMR